MEKGRRQDKAGKAHKLTYLDGVHIQSTYFVTGHPKRSIIDATSRMEQQFVRD